mmetsp:Transcript_26299/g.84112  ORF Transcript_26299/g.84112 Transcript_26299/m.84112 type:complete len:144 (-) Transcript_26299:101-532(-)
MSLDAAKLAVAVGVVVLAHATWWMVSYQHSLKITDQEFQGVPPVITIECIIGGLVCMWGMFASRPALLCHDLPRGGRGRGEIGLPLGANAEPRCTGGLKMQGEFLPIKSEMSARSTAGLVFHPDLANMNTRSHVKPLVVDPLE